MFLVMALGVRVWADPGQGLVAWWNFDEGSGDVLPDRSGNNNDGKIHGAGWVKSGKGYALRFDGVDDYVTFKDTPSLAITGPITVMVWIHPESLPPRDAGIVGKHTEVLGLTYYKNGSCYWYVSSGGNNVSTPVNLGEWQHVAGSFDGKMMKLYVNGFARSSKESQFKELKRGKNLLMGCFSPDPARISPATKSLPHFNGMIDEVRVYDRALSITEIQAHYRHEAAEHGIDTSDFDKMVVTAHPYFEKGLVVVDVDCRSLLALPKEVRLRVELSKAEVKAPVIAVQKEVTIPASGVCRDVMLKARLHPGEYRVGVFVEDAKGLRASETVSLRYSKAEAEVPAPSKHTVAALPPPVAPPKYEVKVGRGGGLTVAVKGRAYRVESSYSYPHGGENRLVVGTPDGEGEDSWKVTTKKVDAKTYEVSASGNYYSISRRIDVEPTRIMVKDTISNTSNDVVGVILSNYINTGGSEDLKAKMMHRFTAFVHAEDSGVGIIALDDLYQLQENHRFANGLAELRTQDFGLDKGAAYTIEWAVYPTATDDYYDFINQVRKDEGLNRRVEGSFAFVPRREPPAKQRMELLNLRYTSIGCLGHPPDDPTVSLEGIEFMEYPQECKLLKETFAKTKQMYPGVKVMFHVAHGLYVTNKPKELFGDSLVIKADGNMIDYGNRSDAYYRKYFSEQRVKEGHRWYIFYPTPDNSFGKAMIKATEYMVNEIGATGMWADGFICGYAQVGGNRDGYSYDRWDGHSVDIDPTTKLVARKKTCVPWAALPVLKKVVQIIAAKGGVTITNGGQDPPPRSLWKEDMIGSCEGSDGAVLNLHLCRAPASLSSAAADERGTYRDILRKLGLGSLYFWYNYKMDHKTLVEDMYPITLESIHAGTIRGKERIVTENSGVYGWQGDRSLHIVRLYDARGFLIRDNFVTTVDDQSVRTEVTLTKDQSAAVVKLPARLTASGPVNVNVRQCDAKAVRLVLNGEGEAAFHLRSAEFSIKTGLRYRVVARDKTQEVQSRDEALTFSIALDGPMDLYITPSPTR